MSSAPAYGGAVRATFSNGSWTWTGSGLLTGAAFRPLALLALAFALGAAADPIKGASWGVAFGCAATRFVFGILDSNGKGALGKRGAFTLPVSKRARGQ